MRILQLIQKKQYRGAEIFCCQLSNHLLKAGHEVEVYSMYEGNAELPLHGKEVKSLNRHQRIRLLDYSGWRQLARIIADFDPDVIQANAADTLKYAVMSKVIFKWRNPLIYRNASAFSFYAKNIFSRGLNSFLLKEVDIIISVSQASKEDLNALFPFTTSKSSVIPVGIDEISGLKSSLTIGFKNQFNLIHIGSFTKEKNHLGILEILKQVHLKIPDVGLHLLGEGPLRQDFEQRIKESGLEKFVHFYGEIQDPFPYLRASDVLILPSLIEGLPGVILEAMYSNISVVAYDVGGIPEIVNDRTGALIEKNNDQAFACAVVKELKNPDKNKLKNAYEMVTEHYLNKEIKNQFLYTYENLDNHKI